MTKKPTFLMVCLLGTVLIYWIVQAGDLEPSGPPAPTMVTLQQIYDKLDECTLPSGLLATGQTTSYAAGDDGAYQTGVSSSPRFTANGDGTVSDNLTGLIWLQDANCFGARIWTNALSDANSLASGSCGLTDGSAPGDWRLPNINELLSLVDWSQSNPSLPPGHPFLGVQADRYWSSTAFVPTPQSVFGVQFHYASTFADNWADARRPWPVRGGQ